MLLSVIIMETCTNVLSQFPSTKFGINWEMHSLNLIFCLN